MSGMTFCSSTKTASRSEREVTSGAGSEEDDDEAGWARAERERLYFWKDVRGGGVCDIWN